MKSKEGSHHSRHGEKKRWKSIPLGIRILIVYTMVLAVFYLIFGLTIPTNVFFGLITFGAAARALNFLFLAVLVAIIYSLFTKKHWAGKLAFVFFAFEILNLVTSFIIRYDIMQHIFIIITSVAIILLNSIILWYLWEKRLYFKDERHFKSGKKDKLFITAIIILASLLILSTLGYAAILYKTTMDMTNKMIGELSGKSKEEAMFKCSSYYDDEKDMCYLVAATAYEDLSPDTCAEIDNNFYRLTCMQAVNI